MPELPIPGYTQVLACAPRVWRDVTIVSMRGSASQTHCHDLPVARWCLTAQHDLPPMHSAHHGPPPAAALLSFHTAGRDRLSFGLAPFKKKRISRKRFRTHPLHTVWTRFFAVWSQIKCQNYEYVVQNMQTSHQFPLLVWWTHTFVEIKSLWCDRAMFRYKTSLFGCDHLWWMQKCSTYDLSVLGETARTGLYTRSVWTYFDFNSNLCTHGVCTKQVVTWCDFVLFCHLIILKQRGFTQKNGVLKKKTVQIDTTLSSDSCFGTCPHWKHVNWYQFHWTIFG